MRLYHRPNPNKNRGDLYVGDITGKRDGKRIFELQCREMNQALTPATKDRRAVILWWYEYLANPQQHMEFLETDAS
jgi:hypothetical protein